MSKCNQHDNSKREFFCTQCCTLACSECIRESHNQHRQYVLNLPDFLETISQEYKMLLEFLWSLMDQIYDFFQKLGGELSHEYIDSLLAKIDDQSKEAIKSSFNFKNIKMNTQLEPLIHKFEKSQIDKQDIIDRQYQLMQGYTYKFCFQNPFKFQQKYILNLINGNHNPFCFQNPFKFQQKYMTTENPLLNLINGNHNPFHVDPQQINSIKQNLQSLINLKNSYKKNLIINQEQAQQIQKYEEKVQWAKEELKRLSF